jgi:hypothetical protein
LTVGQSSTHLTSKLPTEHGFFFILIKMAQFDFLLSAAFNFDHIDAAAAL